MFTKKYSHIKITVLKIFGDRNHAYEMSNLFSIVINYRSINYQFADIFVYNDMLENLKELPDVCLA